MKISKGTTLEFFLGFLFILMDVICKRISLFSIVGIITCIHCLYLWIKIRKENENTKVDASSKNEKVNEVDHKNTKIISAEKDNNEYYYKCSNCGALAKESYFSCANCGEKFDNNEDNNSDLSIDKKYDDLVKLKDLLEKKVITKEEFEKEKKKILK